MDAADFRFLRQVLEGSNPQWIGPMEEESAKSSILVGAKTEWEAARALVPLIHEYGGQISLEEVSSLLRVLLRLVQNPGVATFEQCKKASRNWSVRTGPDYTASRAKYCQDDIEYYRLLFTALGNLFTRAGALVSKEDWTLAIKAFRFVFEAIISSNLVEDPAASRCYAAVLRCVHLVLSDSKSSLEEHVSFFVGSLRTFFMYGLPNSGISPVFKANQGQGTGVRSGSWRDAKVKSQDNGAYRPPHMRGKPHCKGGNFEVLGPDNDTRVKWGGVSSDSELSDSDGQHEEGDRLKSSKVRTSAVLSIQALARTCPKALHAHWFLLLPTHDVLQPRPFEATLLTILLFDPALKARLAAVSTVALMLDGPARAFLQVAEYKEMARSKSFTTLSSSLGQLVIQLLIGLVHVIETENHGCLLAGTLKGLSLLLSASPFSRLPAELLPRAIYSVHQKSRNLPTSTADQSSTMCAAINCLGAALGSTPPSISVAASLLMEIPAVSSNWAPSVRGPSCNHLLLPDLISYTLPPTSPNIRVEAFQALKAAVHNYPTIVSNYWEPISCSIHGTIKHGCGLYTQAEPLNSFSTLQISVNAVVPVMNSVNSDMVQLTDDKIVFSAMKLLDESLRASSGYKVTDEFSEDGLSQSPAPILVPKPSTLLTTPSSTSKNVIQSSQSASDDCGTAVGLWLEALNKHLPPTLVHTAPMVRGAALTCFAGLTNTVYVSLPSEEQDRILSSLIYATSNDDTPAVRSAACRAIGVVMSFPQVAGSKENLDHLVDVVVSSTSDTSVSVRVTASWALANVCDALRNVAESNSLVLLQDPSRMISLTPLAECALKASKDCDKVRANAVRALGNLARFANFGCQPGLQTSYLHESVLQNYQKSCDIILESTGRGVSEPSTWLGLMVQTLVSCVTTGNVKVQWNVCHALGNLFLNNTICLPRMTWLQSVYSILLLLLRDSANFKIRIHSAAALAVPASREDFGVSYNDIVKALVHAMDSMIHETDLAPTSFKYIPSLTQQLTTTFLHVLGLGIPEDFLTLKDFLLKRVAFLYDFLMSLCTSEGKSNVIDAYSVDKVVLEKILEANVGDFESFVYDEKPLPPPKENRRYGLQMNASILTPKGGLNQNVVYLRKAVRALSAMYRYGGIMSAAEKLESLISLCSP